MHWATYGGLVRRIVVVVTCCLLVILSGCRVEASVDVDVAANGSGRVRVSLVLDDDAVARIGDIQTELKLDDLEAADWTVETPERSGVLTVVGVSKAFGAPGDLQRVLDEVAGPGVFGGWKISLDESFASRSWTVSGTTTLSGSLDQFSDDQVADALDGLRLGRTPDELRAEFGGEPSVPVRVTVHLPAEVTSSSTGAAMIDETTRAWSLDAAIGGAQTVTVGMFAEQHDSSAWWWIIGGTLLVIGASSVLALRRRARRPTQRPTRRPIADRTTAARSSTGRPPTRRPNP